MAQGAPWLSVLVLQPDSPGDGLVLVLYQHSLPDTNTDSSRPLVPAGQAEQLQNMTGT